MKKITDKMRLDWLETHRKGLYFYTGGFGPGVMVTGLEQDTRYDSAREAVDAAMRQEEAGK